MEDCVFCKIIKGDIPSAKVWEDDRFLAFLTIAPINPGHTLVIPKKHVPYLFDLDNVTLSELIVSSKPIAHAIKKAFGPKTGRVGVMVAGGEVAHVHIHLIPMDTERDLDFSRQKQGADFEVLKENAEKLKKEIV